MGELLSMEGPRRRGAPLLQYDPAIGDAICEALIGSELGLYAFLASRADLPAWATVNRWMDENPLFREAITRARDLRMERMADGLVALAGEARGVTVAHEVQAVKLQIDTRKWLLSKLKPDVYGDKLDLTSKGESFQLQTHQIDARVQSIVMQAARRLDRHESSMDAGLSMAARALLD